MALLPKPASRPPAGKHAKGQSDHVDAWLMSYADLITLLFMFFVIIVSISVSRHAPVSGHSRGEPEHPVIQQHSGLLSIGTPYDEMYNSLSGLVISQNTDRTIAVEKTDHGIGVDISALQFFTPGSALIPPDQLPLLKVVVKTMADALKNGTLAHDRIEVEGYTDDEPLQGGPFSNNWELAAMRATHIANLLLDEGIDPARLRVISYAGNRPIVPNSDAAGHPISENRARNQRVVIRVEKAAP